MPLLLEPPIPSRVPDPPSDAAVMAARRLLESVARSAEGADLRSQALVELMALEVTCGNELAFERLRHELAQCILPAPIATLFQARVAWGLIRFGRAVAARRSARGAAETAVGESLREWLLEFDRRLDRPSR